MSKWQPIETAPLDEEVLVRVGRYMSFAAVLQSQAVLNSVGEDCDQWQAAYEGEHPRCWSYGCCWDINEYHLPSMEPTHWMHLPEPPEDDHDAA